MDRTLAPDHSAMTLEQRAALHDEARRRAAQLRQAALSDALRSLADGVRAAWRRAAAALHHPEEATPCPR